jgi:hypothetical protein
MERPAGREAEKLAKVAQALAKGLSVAEVVTLPGSSRASVKRYRHAFAAAQPLRRLLPQEALAIQLRENHR